MYFKLTYNIISPYLVKPLRIITIIVNVFITTHIHYSKPAIEVVTHIRTRGEIECLNYGKSTKATQNACQHCGNLMPGKTLWLKEKLGLSNDDTSVKDKHDTPTKSIPESKTDIDNSTFSDLEKDTDQQKNFDSSFSDSTKDTGPPTDF